MTSATNLANKFFYLSLLFTLCGAFPAHAQQSPKADMAKQLLLQASPSAGAPAAGDLADMRVSSETYSEKSGVTHVYFQQQVYGIPIHNAILNAHVTDGDQLLTFGNRFVNDALSKAGPATPILTAEQTVEAACLALGITFNAIPAVKETPGGTVQAVIFDKGDLSLEDIPVQLMWQLLDDGNLRLAWNLSIYETNAQNWWSVRMDALTGELLDTLNWVVHCNFDLEIGNWEIEKLGETPISNFPISNFQPVVGGGSYRVYPQPLESPYDGFRELVTDPANAIASPYGWHDTNGAAGAEFTTTQGNNVHAYTDTNANNQPDANSSPNGGMALVFDYPVDLTQNPSTYRYGAVTNLFYWNNYIHDFAYGYGFDEAAGNFQQNNYGNGGLGGDYVQAEAQDGSGTNNANFATPPDGSKPRMQMYIGTNITPNVDGDLDNGVIVHEYGHGISNRLTGGPANTGCLGNQEQMGEGWSDFFAVMMTLQPGDQGPMARPMGTYLFGQPPTGNGIRPTPYSTDMAINPSTYNTIKTVSVPHGVGYVWCSMIWDMAWALMEAHGQATGYDEALNLVMEGMKLQPCSPGFVDGRNAILAADSALYGGVNHCLIWQVFARRGLGFSANQGSTNNRSDGTEAFNLPPTLPCLSISPASIIVCNEDSSDISVTANANIPGGDLTLSLVGAPAGVSADFTTNPLAPGATTAVSIQVGPSAVQGSYPLIITGTNGSGNYSASFLLKVRALPSVTTLISPAHGALDIYIAPVLTWNAVPNATQYHLQVSTMPDFSMLVVDVMVSDTIHQPTLADNTSYYWRVEALNSPCSSGFSAFRRFTTNCAANISPPSPLAPADMATDISIFPLLDWSDVPNTVTYTLEIATDTGFTNIISSVNKNGAVSQAFPSLALNVNTQYFWRVRANNLCLTPGNNSSVFSFTTNGDAQSCATLASTDVPVPISTSAAVTVTSIVNLPICGTVTDINLQNLGITHTYVNNLIVELTSPEGTTVRVLQQPCGSQNNVLINFDDEAANNYGSFPCPPTNNGFYKPFQPLSAFDDQSLSGVWTMTVKDVSAGDGGSLNNWSLNYCYLPESGSLVTCYQDADGDGYGNPDLSGSFCDACPTGWVPDSTDCDDNNENVTQASVVTCYQDLDTDGYGNAAVSLEFCGTCGLGYVLNDQDCNDFHPDIKPGATEICDLLDNDCDGMIDEGFDNDGDSYTTCEGDCNDGDPAIHPAAAETCNNLDDNCNGFTDEFPVSATHPSTDVPKTIPTTPATVTSTLLLSGLSGVVTDLNVLNLNISHTYIADITSISLTSPQGTIVQIWNQSCGSQNNILINFDDEAANNYGSFPCPPTNNGSYKPYQLLSAFDGQNPNGTWTLTLMDGFNQDGGSINAWSLNISRVVSNTYYADADGDNYGDPSNNIQHPCQLPGYLTDNTDCDDTNPAIHPGALEICNGLDDDCVNGVDDGLTFLDYFLDGDGDLFGAGAAVNACQPPGPDYVLQNGDCDDTNPAIHPGALEICNGLDDDCVNGVDDGLTFLDYFLDGDGDLFGAGSAVNACQPPGSNYVLQNGDCDDSNTAIHPGALEICNGLDDDCVNGVDDGLTFLDYFLDADSDLFGSGAAVNACQLPGPDYVLQNGDCDDSNTAIHPGALEICNGLDDDCVNGIDDGLTFLDYFLDGDGDLFGAGGAVNACQPPGSDYVLQNGDCDDTNSAINPGALEICNGVDDDCSGNPEASANTWTGAGDGVHWSDGSNWSDGIVSLPCQDVAIPAGAVTVPAGFNAQGRALEVVTGAILQVEPTGTVDIQN